MNENNIDSSEFGFANTPETQKGYFFVSHEWFEKNEKCNYVTQASLRTPKEEGNKTGSLSASVLVGQVVIGLAGQLTSLRNGALWRKSKVFPRDRATQLQVRWWVRWWSWERQPQSHGLNVHNVRVGSLLKLNCMRKKNLFLIFPKKKQQLENTIFFLIRRQ